MKKSTEDIVIESIQSWVIQEGIWAKIRAVFEFPRAKHPAYKGMMKARRARADRCRSMYPPRKDVRVHASGSTGEQYGSVSYEDYVENPKFAKCVNVSYVMFLKGFLAWVKKTKPEEVCKFNYNKKRCMKWIKEYTEEALVELKAIEDLVKNMDRTKISKKQYDRVMAMYK